MSENSGKPVEPGLNEEWKGTVNWVDDDGEVGTTIYSPTEVDRSFEHELKASDLPEKQRRQLGLYATFTCMVGLSADHEWVDSVSNIEFYTRRITQEDVDGAMRDFGFLLDVNPDESGWITTSQPTKLQCLRLILTTDYPILVYMALFQKRP